MSQVLGRAMDILDHLSDGPASLAELSRAFDVHKTTIMRALHALEERHYVVRYPDERYHLGRSVFALAAAAMEDRGIQSVAHPHLVQLNRQVGHTVLLAVLEGDDVVYVDKIEPRTSVRTPSRVGLPAWLGATAVAKVLVGSLGPEERQRMLARVDFTEHAPNTLRTPEQVLATWDEAARRNWAADREEHEKQADYIAVPVYGLDGAVWAALSVAAPTAVVSFEELTAQLPLLHEAAQAISADLGYRGEVPAPVVGGA
ncbi:IclR family transcriptional regulator [Rothia sp. AR01]|uniref:IclR family transcriptional regulator n=1 Tax=Rothia santali TaxID=2949643 RepID=A0A9X2HFW6_9MICC|nr:IclR family transcriptional regulator [Rothia santali]MCP3424981.1 IclR family transcriptional regulator [Rothia santali]